MKPWTSTSLLGVALCASIVLLTACPDPPDDKGKGDPPLKADVDPRHEMLPPVAASVQVKELKDNPNGNMLVVADLRTTDVKGSAHAVQLSTGTAVLRDDGKGGDEKAGDRLFSIALTEDLQALRGEIGEVEKNAKELMADTLPDFRGREALPFDKRDLTVMKMKDFDKGLLIPIDPALLCRLRTFVDPARSLMVIHPDVVEDEARTKRPCDADAPSGTLRPWMFGRLMEDAANGTMPTEQFIKNWLNTWLASATVNGEVVAARTTLFTQIIRPWSQKSNPPGTVITTANWITLPLDPALAPFKLTAIVNRLDLRGNVGYGMSNAGEGRFVFEALTPACAPSGPGGFTVIFEYGVPINKCAALKEYAKGWQRLSTLTLGSVEYNDALQALTDVFARANAAPRKANGSALNQIRTNEVDLGVPLTRPWELREFNIDPASHNLVLVDVKQEPAVKYNRQGDAPDAASVDLLEAWVNANEADVVADRHEVPLALTSGEDFRGGHALSSKRPLLGTPIFWDGDPGQITNDDARHHFSLNTCTGCHGQEVNTPFLHVGMVPYGVAAPLSPFLTGLNDWPDAARRPTAAAPTLRDFADLSRRASDLKRLVCTACIGKPVLELADVLRFKPIHMPH